MSAEVFLFSDELWHPLYYVASFYSLHCQKLVFTGKQRPDAEHMNFHYLTITFIATKRAHQADLTHAHGFFVRFFIRMAAATGIYSAKR